MISGRIRAAALSTGLLVAGGCVGVVGGSSEDPELNAARQQSLDATNGLVTVNGFRSRNGLISTALLTLGNGLKTFWNGSVSINGLATRDGRSRHNGLNVDCAGRTLGVNCSGAPDGLLSAETGLMSNDDAIQTAAYLVRCALPAQDAIRIKDYTEGLVSLKGEVGLAPDWKDGDCNSECQEKISACLMAFTNGDGVHVAIEMSAPFTLGVGHSKDYPYQEAAFYGNLFSTPPHAFFCVGDDYASVGQTLSFLEMRACRGYNSADGDCPYVNTGLCNALPAVDLSASGLQDDRCFWTGSRADTATACLDSAAHPKRWNYPITTFRQVRE